MISVDINLIQELFAKLESNKLYAVVIKPLMIEIQKNISDTKLKAMLYTALAREDGSLGSLTWNDIILLPNINDITVKDLLGRVNVRTLDPDMKIQLYKDVALDETNVNHIPLLAKMYKMLRGDLTVFSSSLISNTYMDYKLSYDIVSKTTNNNGFINEDAVNMEFIKRFTAPYHIDNMNSISLPTGKFLMEPLSNFNISTENGLLILVNAIKDPTNKFLLESNLFVDNYLLNWILSGSFISLDADILIDKLVREVYTYKNDHNMTDDTALLKVMYDKFSEYNNKKILDMNFFTKSTIAVFEEYIMYRYILPKLIHEHDDTLITISEMQDSISFYKTFIDYFTKFRYYLLKLIYDFNGQSIDMYPDTTINIPINYDNKFKPT